MTPEWKASVKNSCDNGPHYCSDFAPRKPSHITIQNRVRFQDSVISLKTIADTPVTTMTWADVRIDTSDEVELSVEEVQQISDAVEYLIRR
jgi:hypothetical protein